MERSSLNYGETSHFEISEVVQSLNSSQADMKHGRQKWEAQNKITTTI